MIVGVGRSLLVRVFQIVECARVYLVGGGHLICFKFHLNSDFGFSGSPRYSERYERNDDARIRRLCCSGEL